MQIIFMMKAFSRHFPTIFCDIVRRPSVSTIVRNFRDALSLAYVTNAEYDSIATLGIRNDLFVTDSARQHRYVHMRPLYAKMAISDAAKSP
jgi:hypothetical protein